MGTEIERKFLVWAPKLPLEYMYWPHTMIQQGYLSTNPTVRVRLSDSTENAGQAFITVKGKGLLSRKEYEYEIPYSDGHAMLHDLCPRILRKRRYKVDGWELDEFLGEYSGLWLAEIELPHEDAPYTKPAWAYTEVTYDPWYTNASLAQDGAWPSRSAWAKLYISKWPENEFLTDFLPVQPYRFWQSRIQVPAMLSKQPLHLALYDIHRQPVAYYSLAPTFDKPIPANSPFEAIIHLEYLPQTKAVAMLDLEYIVGSQ